MLDFIHDIFESWILAQASGGIGALRRSLLERHLASCQRCRGFALDLIEFSHGLEDGRRASRLSLTEEQELHTSVMAAFHRDRADERRAPVFERAAGPLVRPVFVQAMAVLALLVGAVFVLSYPYRNGAENFERGQASPQLRADLEPSPTPTPQLKNDPIKLATPGPRPN